jgi:predicted metalloprotease with PDZ domain
MNHPRLRLHYQVAMPQPQSHYFDVRLQIQGWQGDYLDLKFPVWTPGSYLVREYVRHLQDFTVRGEATQSPLPSQKVSKNHWQIPTQGEAAITVAYRIYADELTVRTNHLDDSHGFFTGAALFFYIPCYEQCPLTLTVIPPEPAWQIATTLPLKEQEPTTGIATFYAQDFDTLVDSPVEVGIHQTFDFEVAEKSHQFVVWGASNLNGKQLIKDTQKIIETEAALFGGLPYDRYLFLLHLAHQGFGGLEHKNCCVLNYSRFGFREPEKYQRFLQLVAHEFFHLWNIKRIRPIALEQFDYDQENYTPSLWFSEGTTSYYDLLIPLRAGLYDRQTYLNNLGKEITRYLTTPGRAVQPLAESSFDAWIKLYRRDAHSDNCQMSYYLKGELVTLMLDLLIRDRHQNQRSFDDVMRRMWAEFGQTETGFTPEQLETIIAEVAGTDLTDFFQIALHSTTELPLNDYLHPFGLKLHAVKEDLTPHLGIKVKSEGGHEKITFVATQSPAALAGISPQDELLAIDGIRVNAEQLPQRLKDYQANDMIQLTVFHRDLLRTVEVQLAAPQANRYEVVPLSDPSDAQRHNLAGWLGNS